MKLRLYIVTYKKPEVLNQNLASLWKGISPGHDLEVTVLSNHPVVQIEPENQRPGLRVLINTVRSAHAWGYLSRDWNFGLVDGFRAWNNPDAVDWVVLAQNDVVWKDGWMDYLAGVNHLDFISQPRGDQAMAFRIEAVRKIGFFDERFSTLHFQEIDYFYRAVLALGQRASINDDHLGEMSEFNPVGCRLIAPSAAGVEEADNLHTARFSAELGCLFRTKWRLPALARIHDLRGFAQRSADAGPRPREVNWYPFFWDGDPGASSLFLEDYDRAGAGPLNGLLDVCKRMAPRQYERARAFWRGLRS